jgi:hypothetical protein
MFEIAAEHLSPVIEVPLYAISAAVETQAEQLGGPFRFPSSPFLSVTYEADKSIEQGMARNED